jgi:hypothetical protein
LVLGCCVVAKTDSRPCVVCRPSMAASYFLLLAQKKVTKEKGTLAVAVCRASMPGKLRKDTKGFAGSTSMCSRRSGRHPAGHRFAAFPPSPCRGREGTRKSRARQSLPQKHRIYATRRFLFLSFALPFGSPLSSGGGRTEKPRAPHAGGAMDRADSDNRPWMACGPNPFARS